MPLSIPGRFNRMIQKYLSIKGSATITDVGGEILPVFALYFGAENRYLESWSKCAAQQFLQGVAANAAVSQLRNPNKSNIVAVVEKISVNVGLAAAAALVGVSMERNSSSLVSQFVGAPIFLDARNSVSNLLSGPTCTVNGKTNTAQSLFGVEFAELALATNAQGEFIQDVIQEFPLLPGDAVNVFNPNLNGNLDVSFWWRERALEDSELK